MVEFYTISPYEEYCYNGLQYRQDWMDKLGLKNPKTLADVEATLTAFKITMGAKSPMILPQSGVDGLGGCFLSALIAPTISNVGIIKLQAIPIAIYEKYRHKLRKWLDRRRRIYTSILLLLRQILRN